MLLSYNLLRVLPTYSETEEVSCCSCSPKKVTERRHNILLNKVSQVVQTNASCEACFKFRISDSHGNRR